MAKPRVQRGPGSMVEYAKHLRPFGKRQDAKRVRKSTQRDIKLEAENQQLREALKLIERGTGGFANEVAKAALEGGE